MEILELSEKLGELAKHLPEGFIAANLDYHPKSCVRIHLTEDAFMATFKEYKVRCDRMDKWEEPFVEVGTSYILCLRDRVHPWQQEIIEEKA